MTMTIGEKETLYSYIAKSTHYLEFGAGESTVYASSVPTLKTITSVESSEQFVNDQLMHKPAIANALATAKLSFHFVDIGETVAWGYPKNNLKKHLWPNYALSVFRQKSNHDVILVDGRFRVACTLNAVLNAPDDCTILIHDFWNRPEYYVVLRFLKIAGNVDTLGIFKKADNLNLNELQAMIRIYQYLPGDKTALYLMKEKCKRWMGL